MPSWVWVVLPLASYLLGSVSFAWLAGRLKGKDLRQHGSGNLGATNAGRVLGGHWFLIVFLLDLGKGLGPVLLAGWLPGAAGWPASPAEVQILQLATALGAVLGHVFTCFHGFKGGKAVATSLGAVVALVPLLAAILFAIWYCTLVAVRILFRRSTSQAVGPASVVACAAAVPVRLLLTEAPFGPSELGTTCLLILLSALIILRHRSNIAQMFGARKEGRTAEEKPG